MTAAPAPSITAAQLPALAERYNLPLEAMQVLLEVAGLYSGGAIKGDPTHLCVTGHHVWLARIGLEKLAVQSQQDQPIRCACGDEYPADSYGAGFIDGSGMCPNCDAAIPARDIAAPVAQAEQAFPALSHHEFDDLHEFHRAVCSGAGHRVEKEGMRRLAEIGAVESIGFGKHRLTEFGAYLLAAKGAQAELVEALQRFSVVADQIGQQTGLPTLMQLMGLVAANSKAKDVLAALSAQGDAQ